MDTKRLFKFFSIMLIAIITAAAIYAASSETNVEAQLGGNAYQLQQETDFPMGYPTRSDGLSPVGGDMGNVRANLTIGPLKIECENAYLYLLHNIDIISSGRLFCPTENGPSEVLALRDYIEDAWDWDEYIDQTKENIRAEVYGRSVESGFEYLSNEEMRGTVLRVPLYNWKNTDGLHIEVNAARHVDMSTDLSYEISFSWLPPCLFDFSEEKSGIAYALESDAERAIAMQKYRLRECPPIPGQ